MDEALEQQSFQDLESPRQNIPVQNMGELMSPIESSVSLKTAQNGTNSTQHEKRPSLFVIDDSSSDSDEEK